MTFDVYELIDRIRPRPALYLGRSSITRLDAFLSGYVAALRDLGVKVGTHPFHGFHDWVALRLGYYESTSGWCNMLLEAEKRDEEKALNRFFTYLDEFRHRQGKVILQAVPERTKSWRSILDTASGDPTVSIKPPTLIQIVKYTDDEGVFIRYVGKNGELIDREDYCRNLDVAFFWTESLIDRHAWEKP